MRAGQLSLFYNVWTHITSDPLILSWIRGYRLPLKERVHQIRPPVQDMWSPDEQTCINKEIQHLLDIGAIKPCKASSDQFVLKIFLITKSSGKTRLILNLKNFNKFLVCHHFKMENVKTARRLILPNSFLTSVDLKEAYFLV